MSLKQCGFPLCTKQVSSNRRKFCEEHRVRRRPRVTSQRPIEIEDDLPIQNFVQDLTTDDTYFEERKIREEQDAEYERIKTLDALNLQQKEFEKELKISNYEYIKHRYEEKQKKLSDFVIVQFCFFPNGVKIRQNIETVQDLHDFIFLYLYDRNYEHLDTMVDIISIINYPNQDLMEFVKKNEMNLSLKTILGKNQCNLFVKENI